MIERSGYKKQQKLSTIQFLSELPNFIAVLAAAIVSESLIAFVDLLDSFGNILRTGTVALLSGKLTKDLRYEYNYGIGKIEAISVLLCDGIVFLGLLSIIGVSVSEIISPEKPSNLLIAVVGLKAINVSFDTFFFVNQRKIIKTHKSAVARTNYAAAIASLLFDSMTLVSLLIVWLLRNNPIAGYFSPVISIIIALYLMSGCMKRIKAALDEITDKTLPEEEQMKMLNILNRFYDRYSQFHAMNSHRSGDVIEIDLHLSFDKNTTFEQIIRLKNEMQSEFEKQIGNCVISIVAEDD